MSSHHIVRENQEPALLLEDFLALSEEYLGQLLEWSPTIITNEDNLDFFLANDIKIDFLYTNKEFSYQEETKRLVQNIAFIPDAIDFLVGNNYKAVNVLAKDCYPIFLEFANILNIVVFVANIRYVVIQSRFEKWKSKGQRMFIAVSQLKSFVGLKYIDDNIFEVEQDGFVVIEMNTDEFLFVGEEI